MKRTLTALFVTVVMIVAGAYVGYAAFPIVPHTTAAAPGSNAGSESTMQPDESTAMRMTTAKSMLPTNHKNSGKSQLTALLLCIFLGGLGIHRFYLGYTWQGVVQLLTFGGCGIWALIDLIRIITGDLGPKNGRYGKTL